jgi:hypothetical protein
MTIESPSTHPNTAFNPLFMIILKRLKQFLCALSAAAAGILSTPVTSEAALEANERDLFLCFRAGDGTGYMVNIGSASQFSSATGSITVDIGGNLAANLDAALGDGWETRADVMWSISGVQKTAGEDLPANTMFASRAQPVAGTPSTPWNRPSAFGAGAPALKMETMRSRFITGTTAGQTEVDPNELKQDPEDLNGYVQYQPGGDNTSGLTAFGYFTNGALGIENHFGPRGEGEPTGTAGSVLDLYQLIPGSGAGTRIGTFQLNDSGTLTFTSGISTQALFASATASVNEDAGNVTLTINRTGDTNAAFTLNFSTSNGNAIDGTDFTGQTNTAVAFASGDTSKTVNVAITNRAGFQGNRTFTATISVASGSVQVVSPTTATITIVETSPEPSVLALSAASYDVAENVASGNVTVTVNRSGPSDTATSVSLSTTEGTALAGTDYTAQTNTAVNFAIGETTKNVDIAITNRTGFQGNRDFTVAISAPSNGATLGTPATATVTIQETDPNPAGTIAFSASTYNVTTASNAVITLNRTLGTTGAVSVNVSVVGGGTLIVGEDFTFGPGNGNVQFADGQATADVTIQFTAAVAPLPGTINLQLSDGTNGVTIGTPNTATVNVASTQVTLVSGTYTGLIVPTNEAPPAGNLHNASGLLSVKLTSTGKFSGKVLIGGATLPFAGVFNPDGTATFKVGSSPTFALVKKGKTPVTFGNLTLLFTGDKILATIDNVAVAAAQRAAFDGKTNLVAPNYLLNKGKYTGILPSKGQDELGTAVYPQGHGIGNITVTKQGKFTFKGKLADGTPLSMSGPLAADYTVPLYKALYANKGSIGGVVTLDDVTHADSDLLGIEFLWLRPAQTKAPVYLAGWPGGVKIDLLGAKYATSTTASVIPNLNAEDPAGNAMLEFAAGELTADLIFDVNVSTKNKVTNVPPTDKTRKVTISAPTGNATGFFFHPDKAKKTAFKGIVYQKGPDAGVFGYFLSAPVKGGPAGQSGSVILVPKSE